MKQSSSVEDFLPRRPAQLCYTFLLLCRGSGPGCEPAPLHTAGGTYRAAVASPVCWGRREAAEYGYRDGTHRRYKTVVVSRKSHRQSSICLTTVKFPYMYCSKRVLRRNLRDGHDVDLGGITRLGEKAWKCSGESLSSISGGWYHSLARGGSCSLSNKLNAAWGCTGIQIFIFWERSYF